MLQCILGATNQNSTMAPIMHCCMNIKLAFFFRGDMFVTIAEIHTLIPNACLCIQIIYFLDVSFVFI